MVDRMIRVVLVDPHLAAREALAFVLDRESDFAVQVHKGSIRETKIWLSNAPDPPHGVLVDPSLPDDSPSDLIEPIHSCFPECQVIGLSASADRRLAAQAISAGMAGVLPKSSGLKTVITAIRNAGKGMPVHPLDEMVSLLRLANQVRDEEQSVRQSLDRLTPRETDVLKALAQGLSDKEIARELQVSTNTVAAHIVHILSKLNVHSRLQAVLLGIRHGVIPFK